MKKTMTEKRLNILVYEVREKIQEYDAKLQGLETGEQRLQRAHDLIKKDIEELNNLRIELASTVASLKSERDKLLKSRVEIAKAEKNNQITMAAAFDKMDSESAGKILTNMSKMQKGGVGGSSLDDAVKILHYMTERTKAKLLAGLVTSEPQLAALLCQKLKQIIVEE
jgi:predicted RNase H-like nuclease (RuvC/YqgF family)